MSAELETTPSFDLADVRAINAATMKYVNALGSSEIDSRMRDVVVPDYGAADDLAVAQSMLAKYGIVVFNNALDAETCNAACDAIETLCGRFENQHEDWVECDDVLYQVGAAKLQGFYKLANYGKTVLTVRQGQDQGMIDIFNCDLAAPALAPVRDLFEDQYLRDTIGSRDLRPQNLNAYLNNSIASTRGFHVDSYAEHFKAFVYLTDVHGLDDGPYTYVKGSHMESPHRRANQALCSNLTPATETPLVDPMAITPILASRGALVISDQAGSHRGWPQEIGSRRMAAVMKYAR